VIQVVYSSPTTPGGAGWGEDVTTSVRLGSITGLAGEAELGAVGTGNVVLDDPNGTVGHLGDGIVGLKQMSFIEWACPLGNRRLYTAYVGDRRYHRGQQDSLITGPARKIDVTLTDLNSFLTFRVFAPTADDPTSDFVRPAETHIQRIQALLTTVDFISTTLFDIGYIPTTGGVAMSANDYTGFRPIDVLNDCAQVSGWNFFILYNEATNKLVLWFDRYDTDGSTTLAYDSTLRLTNIEAQQDNTTTFAIEPDAVEVLDPSRVISAAYGTGTGITGYETSPTTAYTFAWRDAVMPSEFVKEQAKLDALLTRYLTENATEASRVSCTVRVPNTKVTAIHEGMRIEGWFTHLPSNIGEYRWYRILQRTIRQDVENEELYWLDLEMTPLPETVEPAAVIYRAFTDDDYPAYNGATNPLGLPGLYPIAWRCSGDLDESPPDPYCTGSLSDPTVGPLHPSHGTISDPHVAPSNGPYGSYLGFTFEGSGTIDFTGNFQGFGAINGKTLHVDILIDGVVVASDTCVTAGGAACALTVVGTAVPVNVGSILTGRFYTNLGSAGFYLDVGASGPTGVALRITGGSLFA
jgi:hypothetical protein